MTRVPCPRCFQMGRLRGVRVERGYLVACPRCDGSGTIASDDREARDYLDRLLGRVRDGLKRAA